MKLKSFKIHKTMNNIEFLKIKIKINQITKNIFFFVYLFIYFKKLRKSKKTNKYYFNFIK